MSEAKKPPNWLDLDPDDIKPKLWVCAVEIEAVVEAPTEEEARKVLARERVLSEEASNVDESEWRVSRLTRPEGRADEYPYGGTGDETIGQILGVPK